MFVYLKINICKYLCIPVSSGGGNSVASGASSVPNDTSTVANSIGTPGISLADWIGMVNEIEGEIFWHTSCSYLLAFTLISGQEKHNGL